MNDDGVTERELRAMVRESIARVGGRTGPLSTDPGAFSESRSHASHRMLPLLGSGDADGMCLIEPAVRCSHCGYCLSYGH